MGIVGGLLFIALGAVLAFGIRIDNAGALSLDIIGWILMLVGALGLALTFVSWRPRRRTLTPDIPPEEDDRGPHMRDAGPPP
ncbi:uncharacterized membrane protein YbhN (UPF0104 family) [Spinactinospora alkalitolerans]|uniref:Uncharacterized membrane protein YbhN (UPF0104 family) n=1 Tax=Spinactinospora alkalitolerans TaxID=687207 RepID=A0A852TUV8_9ACTN|nr:DUF6458 family protein [Spinactinospora alkalitolerans]NYE48236.1 uncharacterized membrane protein YbhN (UPF0104 family) [Spinactinospora alkalitolerans]